MNTPNWQWYVDNAHERGHSYYDSYSKATPHEQQAMVLQKFFSKAQNSGIARWRDSGYELQTKELKIALELIDSQAHGPLYTILTNFDNPKFDDILYAAMDRAFKIIEAYFTYVKLRGPYQMG